MERSHIKEILRENLNKNTFIREMEKEIADQEGIDRFLDKISEKGMEGLNYDDLADAPQKLIDEFMLKMINANKTVKPEILTLSSQQLVDKYLMGRIKNGQEISYMEILEGSIKIKNNYVKKKGEQGFKIEPPKIVKMADSDVVDEYVKQMIDKGVFLEPEYLANATDEGRQYYKRNKRM